MQQFTDINPNEAEPWIVAPGDWRRPGAEGRYQLLWDPARSYGQVWPRPGQADVIAFYDVEEYYTHQERSVASDAHKGFQQLLQTKISWWLDKGVEPDRNWWSETLGGGKRRILEVGCGNGANLTVFRSLGHEAVGVEPDAAALEVARKQGHRVFQGAAETLPTEVMDDRFDAVVFIHVLEHCVNPSLALGNARGILGRGGLVVAEVPNNECHGVERFGELWHWLDAPRHLNFFTSKSLGALISASGLRVDQVLFRGYCRQFGAGWKAAQSHIARTFGAEHDRRVSSTSYWRYLLETAWARDAKKYDSVRIVGSVS